MASEQQITIDLSKATHELERMIDGEIPFDLGYINELVETNTSDEVEISFSLVCDECNALMVYKVCPECEIAASENCSLCNGAGGWFECEVCDG